MTPVCGFVSINIFTNAESPICKNGPCQVCTAVKKVDEEINQAAAGLRRLLVKRCDLRSEQNSVHGSLMHRLPIEIKNYIFELLQPLRDNWGRIDVPGIIMPLYLTSVCRSWRDIAWSNPFLWSTIHIGIGRRISRTSDRINFVREWILRSRTTPLTLHLDLHRADVHEDDEEFKGLIDAISQSSNRWHSLSFKISWGLFPSLRHTITHCQHLKRLRIKNDGYGPIDQPVPFLNPEVSPEEIDILGVSFRSLQISWNHLSSARVEWFTLGDIVQLFRHAQQMTACHIFFPIFHVVPTLPSITQRLKTLTFCGYLDAGVILIRSLTLPCLEEFRTNKIALLTPTSLPALVERSSCPLTKITLLHDLEIREATDLVLESSRVEPLNLEEYFPDLSRLTLQLQPFLRLWRGDKLLICKWPWAGGANEGRHRKILVIDSDRAGEFSDLVWKTDIGERLKSMQWKIRLREDGFELMVPEV